MSTSSLRTFIPFGSWHPDPPDYDTDALADCKGAIPIWGGYRPLNQIPSIVEQSDSGNRPFTGAHIHHTTEQRSNQMLRPDGDHAAGNWTTFSGGTSDLYSRINSEYPANNEGIKILGAPSSEEVEFDLDDPLDDPAGSSVIIRCQYEIVNHSGANWTLDIDLKESGTSVLTAAQQETGSADVGWTDFEYTLTSGERSNISDYDDLEFSLIATVPGGGATEIVPDEDVEIGGWLGQSGDDDTDIYEYVDEAAASINDSDYIESPQIGANSGKSTCTLGLAAPGTKPPDGTWELKWRTNKNGSGTLNATVRLLSNGTEIASDTANGIAASWTTRTLTLSSSEKTALLATDLSNLEVIIEGDVTSGTAQLRVSWLQLQGPDDAGCRVSWIEVETDDPTPEVVDDIVHIFGGTETKLRLHDGTEFENVTRTSGGDYGDSSNGVTGTAWSFTSFGQAVLACNFADELQIMDPSTDTDFADVTHGGSDSPRARHCMVVGPHVVLGDLNDLTPAGQADEIMWSGENDPEHYQTGDAATGSDRQVLYHAPGRITGMVGMGDFGLIFKRGSIIRIDYVGAPLFMQISVLARGVGTPFPKSIVRVGPDAYFFTGYDCAVVRSGSSVEIMNSGVVKYLTDEQFESRAMQQGGAPDNNRFDNTMVGAYNEYSGCIFWMYRSVDDTIAGGQDYYDHKHLICYSVREDKWARIEGSAQELNQILSSPQLAFDGASPTRGLKIIGHGDTAKYVTNFNDDSTYATTIKTKILTSQTFVGDENQKLVMTGVRPIVRGETDIPDGFGVTMSYALDGPFDSDNVSSITRTWGERDQDGVIPLDVSAGTAFQFQFDYPSVTNDNVRTLVGAEYFYEYQSER